MKRVKLYSLWVGPLPAWMPEFLRRVRALETVDWELLLHNDAADCCRQFNNQTGLHAAKATPYACGDLRPWIASITNPKEEWWGWCDLDVVLGDLDRLLPPLLDAFDVVSAEPGGTAGCLTVFRNCPETRDLWRGARGWEAALADPAYRNFDEVGFSLTGGNPSVTRALRRSNLRCHFDWRSWHQDQEPVSGCGGPPSRSPLVDGRRVLEVPTGRELLLYHFRAKTGWPVPDPWESSRGLQERWLERGREPKILSPEFWAERLRKAKAGGEPHRAVWDVTFGDWQRYQEQTGAVLAQHLRAGDRVLDCGCGPGLMASVLPPLDIEYGGVDFCEPMIEQAIVGHMKNKIANSFRVVDLRNLTDKVHENSLSWCVCRNLEGDADAECAEDWAKMRREMLRVAPRLLLMDLRGKHRVIERGT